MHPNAQAIRSAYAALQAGDSEAAASIIAEDAVLHLCGESPLAGDYKGRDTIVELVSTLRDHTNGSLELWIHDVLANDGPDPARIPLGHAVVLLGATAERHGTPLDSMGVAIMHFRGDKAVEAWLVPINQAMFDSFWAGIAAPAALIPLSERGTRGY